VHFLQFATHENTAAKGVEHHKLGDDIDGRGVRYKNSLVKRLYYFGDKMFVDTTSTNPAQPWYDAGPDATQQHGEEKGGGRNYLSIYDDPDDDDPDPTKYTKSEGVFDTYLVVNGQILYRVRWTKTQTLKGGSWTSGDYIIDKQATGETHKLDPADGSGPTLFGGYELLPDDKPGKEITFKNPFAR